MAGVPCFNDTCSTIISVDGSGKIDINSRLDPSGGISCGTDADPNSGLRINLLGNPAAVAAGSISDCDNLLGYTTDGFVFAQRPRYEIYNITGDSKHIPDVGVSDNSLNFDITNNMNCDRLAIVTARLRVHYIVPATGDYKMGNFSTLDIPGKVTINEFSDIGGYNGVGVNDERFHDETVTTFFTVNGGQTITLVSNSTNQTVSNATANTGDRGFTATIRIALLDLAAGDLF